MDAIHQPCWYHPLGRHCVGQPRVSTPRPPQPREQRGALDSPGPREVIGEEAGYLGEGEHEDQVEEQFEGVTRCSVGSLPSVAVRAEPAVLI